MAAVQDLLEIYQLSGLRVAAGEDGLENRVGTVTVMEVPETIQYLRGDDFLITSLYSIGNDTKRQCELVEGLLQTKSACLAIKLGKYAEHISPEMLALANESGFPILLIPKTMTYIQIIMSVMNVILTEKNMEDIAEKYIQDILFETYSDQRIMIERGRILGMDFKSHVFQTILIQTVDKNELTEHKARMLRFMARQLSAYIRELKLIETCSVMFLENHAVLVLEGRQQEDLMKCSVLLKEELLKRMKNGFHNSAWKMGMGCVGKGFLGVRKSYETSLQVIETGSILMSESDIYNYQDLKIYCGLKEMLVHSPISLFEDVLQKIQSPELLHTLEIYYKCDGNMEQAAQILFTHKNTVKYRINKIKELTGLDTKCQEDNFKLHLMLLEKRLKLEAAHD